MKPSKRQERNLVALSGKAGVGKSTISQILVEDYGFMRYSFADPIYLIVVSTLKEIKKWAPNADLPEPRDIDVDYVKSNKKRFRSFLQTLGTDLGREAVGPKSIWVNSMQGRLPRTGNIVIDDLRFKNEYDLLKDEGAYIFEIVGDNESEDDDHISEHDLDGVSRIQIRNPEDNPYAAVEDIMVVVGRN